MKKNMKDLTREGVVFHQLTEELIKVANVKLKRAKRKIKKILEMIQLEQRRFSICLNW